MWHWFNCYLSGRHDYGVWCEPGAIFLRCVHCGRRSSGWAVAPRPQPAPVVAHVHQHAPLLTHTPAVTSVKPYMSKRAAKRAARRAARQVLQFPRAVAR